MMFSLDTDLKTWFILDSFHEKWASHYQALHDHDGEKLSGLNPAQGMEDCHAVSDI